MPVVGQKTNKALPTPRIAFQKQVEILRAFGAACGMDSRTVTNAEVGKIVGLKPDTVSLGNSFFVAIDLLTRAEGGNVPSEEVLAYARAHEWLPEEAFEKVAPKLEKTWFAEALLPRLRFGPLSVDQAIGALGEAAGIGQESKTQLEILLAFLEHARLIERDNGNFRIPRPRPSSEEPKEEVSEREASTVDKQQGAIPKGGGIRLDISIDVNMGEMAKWSSDRITAFMGGLAQVLSAKGNLDKLAV
jgi:hypothetical protein